MDDWAPTTEELRVLSAEMVKFCRQLHPIYSLDISVDLALDMFKNNPHKTKQIPDIAASNGGVVTVFKAGLHVDISKGPMVANTSHIGKTSIANVIKLQTDVPGSPIYRFQGVSLPMTIILNHFAYGLLEKRAKKMVSKMPSTFILFTLNCFCRTQRGFLVYNHTLKIIVLHSKLLCIRQYSMFIF